MGKNSTKKNEVETNRDKIKHFTHKSFSSQFGRGKRANNGAVSEKYAEKGENVQKRRTVIE